MRSWFGERHCTSRLCATISVTGRWSAVELRPAAGTRHWWQAALQTSSRTWRATLMREPIFRSSPRIMSLEYERASIDAPQPRV